MAFFTAAHNPPTSELSNSAEGRKIIWREWLIATALVLTATAETRTRRTKEKIKPEEKRSALTPSHQENGIIAWRKNRKNMLPPRLNETTTSFHAATSKTIGSSHAVGKHKKTSKGTSCSCDTNQAGVFFPGTTFVRWNLTYLPRLITATTSSDSTWSSWRAFSIHNMYGLWLLAPLLLELIFES